MVPRSIRPYEDEFFLWRDSMALQIGLFILTFLFVFVIYELFLVRKAKKNKAKKKPVEVQYLVNRYHIDLKKVNYKKLLNVISFVSSLDIAIVVTIISLVDNMFLQLALGFVTIFIVILISYDIVGKVYQKKGMKKDV